MRQLGHRLNFKNRSIEQLLTNKQIILSALKQHGAICISNAELKPKDMARFTKNIFGNTITLPEKMAFMNVDRQFPNVSRVGNVLPDGTLKDSSKEAIFWHSDGDFWGDEYCSIFNVLHSVEQPQIGGNTDLIDLVKAARFIKEKKPELYSILKKSNGIMHFESIKDFFLYGDPNFKVQKTSQHKTVREHDFNQMQSLYLSVDTFEDCEKNQQIQGLKGPDIIAYLEEEMGYYSHKWEHGDIFIWDNVQTLHRSSGPFKGRRLLYKCHGSFKKIPQYA